MKKIKGTIYITGKSKYGIFKSLISTYSFLCFSILSVSVSFAQISPTSNRSAIVHSKFRTADSGGMPNDANAVTTIQYFDGLGNPMQTVGYRQSPTKKDIVLNVTTYDKQIRPKRTYLPFAVADNTGSYHITPQVTATAFYVDASPYQEVLQYDYSPLDRPRVIRGAGQAWADNNRTKKTEPVSDVSVKLITADASGNLVFNNRFLTSGNFWSEAAWDEHNYQTVKITDVNGKQILTRDADNGFTHYVYDHRDRLYAIIQPQGYDFGTTGIIKDSDHWQKYVFAYEYDLRNRIIRKHIPGAGWMELIYDRADRVVMQQNAYQKTLNRWNFIQYDVFGRIVASGEMNKNITRASAQALFNSHTTTFESRTGATYDGASFPVSVQPTSAETEFWNYYDNYLFLESVFAFNASGAFHTQKTDAKGLLTGMKKRNSADDAKIYTDALYYDNLNRVIQSQHTSIKSADNTSNIIVKNFEYNFANEVIKEHVTYPFPVGTVTTKTHNYYDHVGRPIRTDFGINNEPIKIIEYTYDEIGRLSQKKYLPDDNFIFGIPDYLYRPPSPTHGTEDIAAKAVILEPGTLIDNNSTYSATISNQGEGGTPFSGLQTMNYSWHIRGGLRGINIDGSSGDPTPDLSQGDLFAYKLDFETAGQWNDNIGRQSWNHVKANTSVGIREYTYTYDGLNRLKSALFSGLTSENFSVHGITYDKSGNILHLQRKGKINSSAFGDIDDLTYSYSGNQLISVSDAVAGNDNTGDFRDTPGSTDYTYWENGTLKSDANKGISLIDQNTFLDRISNITYSNSNWIKFTYDGSGYLNKRENSNGDYWEYIDKFIYKNGQPYSIKIPEGRAIFEGGVWKIEFEYRDHQDNLRVTFRAEDNKLVQTQTSTQDPWGLEIQGLSTSGSTPQNYKFQNQEKIDDFGLDINCFKYRPFDPQIGRGWQVDRLADQYVHNSVYAFSENKVTSHIELDGLEAKKTVPEWLRKGYTAFANTVFKSTFNSELAKNLVEHYSYGEGKTYNLSLKEMAEVNGIKAGIQGMTENDIKQFSAILENIPNGGTEYVDILVAGGSLNSGTLGRFGMNFEGILSKSDDGDSWNFNGTMQYNDIWDFVTTPTRDGDIQRSSAGDIMTLLGDMYLPGKGFSITSDKIPVTQSNKDKYVSFFNNLSPKAIVNKVVNELETKE